MAARVRRLVVVLLLGVIAALAVRWWSRRGSALGAAASWPPLLEPDPSPIDDAPAAAPAFVDVAPSTNSRWVPPLADGSCPDGYPVKANDNSGIFHVPGGRFYDRTTPERCYAEAGDAAADGYRPAKA
jgi:hypothetical protein